MRAADGGQTQMERATGQRGGEGTAIEVGEHVIRDRALPARQLGGFPLPNHRWTRLCYMRLWACHVEPFPPLGYASVGVVPPLTAFLGSSARGRRETALHRGLEGRNSKELGRTEVVPLQYFREQLSH